MRSWSPEIHGASVKVQSIITVRVPMNPRGLTWRWRLVSKYNLT